MARGRGVLLSAPCFLLLVLCLASAFWRLPFGGGFARPRAFAFGVCHLLFTFGPLPFVPFSLLLVLCLAFAFWRLPFGFGFARPRAFAFGVCHLLFAFGPLPFVLSSPPRGRLRSPWWTALAWWAVHIWLERGFPFRGCLAMALGLACACPSLGGNSPRPSSFSSFSSVPDWA